MADLIFKAGGFDLSQLKDPAARRLIDETASAINRAVEEHLPVDVPETLRYALEENGFIFSGFKTFHSLRELGLSLLNGKGEIKSYEEFQTDVLRLNNKYNRDYLYSEYKLAVGSSQMAANWVRIAADGDRYLLQYRTAGDERVREDHAALNGITLPPSDPFWDKYYPPNGWGCRCTAVQVRRGKYAESDPTEAMKLGDDATLAAKQQIFRFNPGKTLKLFPPKHPYYKAPAEAKKVVEEASHSEHNRQQYESLKNNRDYTDVQYDEKSGGVRAMHVGHNTKCNASEILKWDMTGADLENEAVELLFRSGHSVILCDESKKKDGKTLPALDIMLDGVMMDIRSITENKLHYGAAIKAENNQLYRYNLRDDVTQPADTICLYFHDAAMHAPEKISKGMQWLAGFVSTPFVKHVVCVLRQSDNSVKIIRHDFD